MPYDSSSLWSGECFIVRHHTKSMLVDHENEEYWIPYSQVHDDSELYEKQQPTKRASSSFRTGLPKRQDGYE